AIAMARAALDNAGLSNEAITRAETLFRLRDGERLTLQMEAGDPRAARDRILIAPEPQELEGEPG
ncbi:MAG: sodium:proton exchanger, partial [Novosphingobium sp.]|nr:sodium:proton exchanger [Novosphingobium sp.]